LIATEIVMTAIRCMSQLSFFSHAEPSTRLIPALNHLFMPAAESATGAEYFESNAIPPEVIATIAGWIASLHSTSSAATR
jgi:hypothetical protein